MSMRLTRALGLTLALMLSGCGTVTPAHVALTPQVRDNIQSTEVVAPIRQSEIYVYVPPTTAGESHGLIGALVDASIDTYRANTAEKAIKPLRDAVVDMNFDGDLENQLKASLGQIGWLHLDRTRVIKDATADKFDQAIGTSADSAVLLTSADYHISTDGSQFVVYIGVDFFANSPALAAFRPAGAKVEARSDPSNSLYRNAFLFQTTLPNPSSKRDVNMAAWSATNGAVFRSAMKQGLAKLGDMIALDMQSNPAGPTGAASSEAMTVRTDPDGVLVRNTDGTLAFTANPRGQ